MKDYSNNPLEISTRSGENLCVRYLPYGTIAYLKTKDNEIYQAKLVGIEWQSDHGYGKPVYEWKVAGHKEHFFGSESKISLGTLYDGEDNAQHGSHDGWQSEGKLDARLCFNMRTALVEKYGNAIHDLVNVSWDSPFHHFYVYCYALLQSGSIVSSRSEIKIWCDQDGMHISIPRLDDKQRYLTEEDARKAFKPKKVHTFDDDDDINDEEKEKTITMKIEVKESDLAKIKEIIKIID